MPPFQRDTVRSLRESLTMSQREFADHLGVPQTTVGRWETGRTTPSADYLGLMFDLARRHTIPFEPFASETPPEERVEIAQVAATEWIKKSRGPRGKDLESWSDTFHQMLTIVASKNRQLKPLLEELETESEGLVPLEAMLVRVQQELKAA